jgi:hypothetical protein
MPAPDIADEYSIPGDRSISAGDKYENVLGSKYRCQLSTSRDMPWCMKGSPSDTAFVSGEYPTCAVATV